MTNPIGDARFALRAGAFAAYTLGTIGRFELETLKKEPAHTQQVIAATTLRYGRAMARLFGVRIEAAGFPELGHAAGKSEDGMGRVFVSNHRSALDIFITLALLEGRHVSRADLAKWPVLGPAARRAGILFVDRASRRSSANVVQEMIAYVQGGLGLIVFPEGTTYAGDEVREFKPGAFAVARRTGCEIVPLGLAYAGGETAFGDESVLEHMRRVAGSPLTRVGAVLGTPFRADKADSAQLAARAHGEVQRLVHEARALVS